MQENRDSYDLFDNAPGGDWQIVDHAEAENVTVSGETAPRPVPVPQIWDDIPREEPKPQSAPDATPETISPQEMVSEPKPEPEIFEEIPAETPVEVQESQPIGEIPEPQAEEAAIPAPQEEETPIPAPQVAEVVSPAPSVPEVVEGSPVEEIDAEIKSFRYVAPAEISTLAEIGHYLASIRQKENLSEAEVSEATKIRGDYLAAIESGDASDLPQAVYVLAYIRKLCELYRVDTANLGDFFADLRDGFSYELPEDINKSIIGHENDEEQQKKMRQLAIGLVSAAAIVLIALVVGAVTLIVTLTGNGNSKACTISDRKIIEYQGKPALYMQKLPARR